VAQDPERLVISHLRISGLGVIDAADIEPGPGLTCLTGETGAGKTMVLTALSLLRGDKCAPGLVRGDRARVDATLALTSEAATLVAEIGGEAEDDGEVVVSRVVPAEGRSRAFVGGASVATAGLANLTETLVAVHGQSDQWRLRSPSAQRELLDAYAGEQMVVAKARYRTHYDDVTTLRAQVREAQESATSRQAEAAQLRQWLEQIEAVDPQAGEDEALAAEAERLTNIEDLLHACASAHAAVSGGDDELSGDAVSRLATAHRALAGAASHDPALAVLAQRAEELATLTADFAGEIAGRLADYDADPGRLEWVQSRRSELTRLTRAIGGTINDVRDWADKATVRLSEIDDDGHQDRLAAQLRSAEDHAATAALAISELRTSAATELTAAVTAELTGLAMPDAKLTVVVEQSDDPTGLEVSGRHVAFNAEGVDQVTFLLAAHRGATAAPLGQGASGGELSRVMLALEVSLADSRSAPTMVFDEVDAGVGGKAAVEIGRRLARLATHTQVIVVTHLPQVAAFADTHLRVRKDSSGQVTVTSVEPVTADQRRKELARMLAGQEDSDHAMAHAEELLEMAATESKSRAKARR